MLLSNFPYTATVFNRSQASISEGYAKPRVWGAEAPSSKSCNTKGHEVGFCITGRNLLW